MSEPFIAEIKMFAGNYVPRGYALCQGQLLPLQQNQALAAVIGNLYGGTLPQTIGLPHFGGVSPIGQGQAPGIAAAFSAGQGGGAQTVTLTNNNLPLHTHQLGASNQEAVGNAPSSTAILAAATDSAGTPLNIYGQAGDAATPMDTQLAPQAIGQSGASAPLSVRNPCLAVSFIIALTGIYPSRN